MGTVQETTLEQTISVKSAALSTVNDEIDDIIAKLAILTSQLKVEEKGLAETRPTDISQLQSSLKQSLLKVQYPLVLNHKLLEIIIETVMLLKQNSLIVLLQT